MRFIGVPSALPPWSYAGPARIVFYDPDADIDLASLDDTECIPVPAGSAQPVYIPGDPQPTEEHYAEVARLNPALAGWSESFG